MSKKLDVAFIKDSVGNTYNLKGIIPWRNLWILEGCGYHESGPYAIIPKGEEPKTIDFQYDEVVFVGNYLVAYRTQEFTQEKETQLYDGNGKMHEEE